MRDGNGFVWVLALIMLCWWASGWLVYFAG